MDDSRHFQVLKCTTQEDVYVLSADIGREIEHLVDGFGVESVKSLVPKLIRVLEFLEASVKHNESRREDVEVLQQQVQQLEYDKKEKAQFRKKFEMELEQIEDVWRTEMKDLSDLVSRLQEENTRLSSSLKEQKSCCGSLGDSSLRMDGLDPAGCDSGIFTNSLSQSDIDMLNRLKEAFNKQSAQLHSYEKELSERLDDIQSLEKQVERLQKVNGDGSSKVKVLEGQLGRLQDEREQLAAQLDEEKGEKEQLKHQISIERKDKQDELLEAVIRNSPPSVSEYKKVCQDKKELEARVRFLESELEFYKPPVAKTPSEDSGGEIEEVDEDDLPVQGPINREPDDKLHYSDFSYRASSLSIKRFFPKLLWSSKKS